MTIDIGASSSNAELVFTAFLGLLWSVWIFFVCVRGLFYAGFFVSRPNGANITKPRFQHTIPREIPSLR